ncbi:EAL domain-containing protein [Bradyrhizobium sp.]|uniref:bifunctional diguanylate cyclase/phosphodiesterase n=1 Tax=Bradyrhizobium sp. TaxID=376 RepID=UPI002736791A|nr:EAL domain-containing protein [Bradyrhizobium sp.]MDP3691060.1 EAL domain-containing protein [Bradyrhizobium sp.]
MYQVLNSLMIEHDWRLVALAGAVCLLASAVTVSLFQRAQQTAGNTRLLWLGLDAAAGGFGIWATHFVAMLAYGRGTGLRYDFGQTAVSLLLAVVITGAGLGIAVRHDRRWIAATGGAVVGLGIAAMHYTGMLALELPARLIWSHGTVAASLLLGVVFSSLAVFVAARREDFRHGAAAAALLAIAILAHHFTAMGAVSFIPDPAVVIDGPSLSSAALALFIAGAAAILLGMCLLAALLDRRSKGELRQQEILLDTALENMSQGLCMCDADGRIVLFNERYTRMMGRTIMSFKGRRLLELFEHQRVTGEREHNPEQVYESIVTQMRGGQTATRIVERNGRTIRVVNQPMDGGGWVATFEDITEWQQAQQQIFHMARHDALTDLPNRTLFRERLELALGAAGSGDRIAVLCLDLDHFKDINDTLGHPIGDALLRDVARRLRATVRAGDTVARLGGDEFAIVQLRGDAETSAVAALAGRIVDVIGAPYDIDGHQLTIGVSIGITLVPDDGGDPDQLLKHADLALYHAKAEGRGVYRFFEPGMDARAQARRTLELDLRTALSSDQFEVHYQPIHNLEADRIVAFEALLRWNHPRRGLIAPIEFIPVAEQTGLMIPLGDWVLRRACRDAAGWPGDIRVAVNLSPVQFRNPDMVSSVTAALAAAGLPARRLELEITETALLQNSEATLSMLHALRGHGVQIAMDDFGTGYSSLSYLRSFPFDRIKIDGSFVGELSTRGDAIAIIHAVAVLARRLGISTTAEGVETREQLAMLRLEGCTEAQGYLFGRPRPAVEVDALLSGSSLREVA